MRLLLLIYFVLSLTLTFAQTQRESLDLNTKAGSSWLGVELGFGDYSIQSRSLSILFFTVRPNINYSYFFKNRFAIVSATIPGITFDVLSINQVESSAFLGGSLGVKGYFFKRNGIFSKLDYQYFVGDQRDLVTGQIIHYGNLGLVFGYTWCVGDFKTTIIEVQTRMFGTNFDRNDPLSNKTLYRQSVGIKYLLGPKITSKRLKF